VPPVDTIGDDDDDNDGEIVSPNPPTPNHLDISLRSLRGDRSYFARRQASETTSDATSTGSSSRSDNSGNSGSTLHPPAPRSPSLGPPADSPPPPGYAPLDPHVYSLGLPTDLPEDLIHQAIAAMDDSS
jgi:hypothetical protein